MIKMTNIKNRNKELYNKNNDFLSIKEYKKCVISVICKSYPTMNYVIKDEDIISNLMTEAMMADWRWNGKGTQEGYRVQCIKWAFLRTLKKSKKEKVIIQSLDRKIANEDTHTGRVPCLKDITPNKKNNLPIIQDMLSSKILTKKQRERLEKRIVENMSIKDIAKEEGVSKQIVHKTISDGILKLRKKYNDVYSG